VSVRTRGSLLSRPGVGLPAPVSSQIQLFRQQRSKERESKANLIKCTDTAGAGGVGRMRRRFNPGERLERAARMKLKILETNIVIKRQNKYFTY